MKWFLFPFLWVGLCFLGQPIEAGEFQKLVDEVHRSLSFRLPIREIKFFKSNSREHGHYEPQEKIIYLEERAQSPRAFQHTVAHEMAHAFVLEYLNPRELIRFSQRVGGWKPKGETATLYGAGFFESFSGRNLKGNAFRSVYSYTNIHEWFAELFADYVLKKMGYPIQFDSKIAGELELFLKSSLPLKTAKKRSFSREFAGLALPGETSTR